MATFTGVGLGLGAVQAVFGSPFVINNPSETSFSVSNSLGAVFVIGSGLTYSSSTVNGQTVYQVTGGTITNVNYFGTTGSNQFWSGLNVSAAAAFNDILDSTAFNNLFFSGDDTFEWQAIPGTNSSVLSGLGGNDTFNITAWDNGGVGSPFVIDGGSGNNTLNIDLGVGTEFGSSSGAYSSNNRDLSSGNLTDFNVTNIQTINLAPDVFYTIFASSSLDPQGATVTVNGSALGVSDPLIFNTNLAGGTAVVAGNLVLLGGAGNDELEGGTGNTVFNGGGGNNTVDFMWGQQRAGLSGVTADLSNTGTQDFGTGYGTGTFINIQNLTGTRGNDTLTGDANDNIFTGEGGNDTINGGAGFDTAVFANPYSSYTITHSGATTTVAGPEGTTTLTSVELGQFTNLLLQISGPVVSTQDINLRAGQSVALSSMFSVNDLNSLPITEYQLWDSTSGTGSGYFTVNGAAQPSHTIITISAAQLAQTAFVGGTVSSSLQIRAYDGISWSASDTAAWAPFAVSPPANHPPMVTTANITAARNQTLPLAGLFLVSDADGDAITEYQLWDSTGDPNSGYFTVNGVAQPAHTVITISAAQLAQTDFVTNKVSDSLQIRAFDGQAWSAPDTGAPWAPFTVSVPQDNAPVVTTSNLTEAPGQTLPLSSLFSVTDADGDPITEYQLWESTRDPNAGYWVVNGVAQPPSTIITVTAAQAAQTSFVTGTAATSLQIRASDGILWSAGDNAAWAPFTVTPPVNHPPVVTTGPVNASRNQTLALSSLFSVSDADGDTMTKYELWDSTGDPNSGYFTVNGVAQPAHTIIDITAAQLSQTAFVTGKVDDSLQIRAFDGQAWSAADNAAWAPFTVSVPADNPPVVTTGTVNAMHGRTLALSSLFSVSDADGDPITEYQLWDSTRDPNSGHFVVGGVVQPPSTVITISAAQLAQTSFVTGTVSNNLQIRAFDGINWSAPDNGAWSPFNVNVTPYTPPTVITSDINTAANQTLALSSMFSVSDPDGDTMTKYELWDSTGDPNSGYFVVNGVAEPAHTIIDVTAAQLAQTSFLTGTVGDALQIRAFDGISWSAPDNGAWSPFHVNVS